MSTNRIPKQEKLSDLDLKVLVSSERCWLEIQIDFVIYRKWHVNIPKKHHPHLRVRSRDQESTGLHTWSEGPPLLTLGSLQDDTPAHLTESQVRMIS